MNCEHHTVYPGRDLPLGCWHNILAAAVNRTCRAASHDDRLWCPLFKKAWSPESCGSLRTKPNGKQFRALYGRWQTGQPAAVDLIPGVHAPDIPAGQRANNIECGMTAVQLSQAGALATWSTGWDGALVGTDVATCQIRNRFLPPRSVEVMAPLNGVTVLDSVGLVCAGGTYLTGWDPRQKGNGPSRNPAFTVKHRTASGDDTTILTMISACSPEGDGPPQLLTGAADDLVHLWDLRFIDAGPVRHYTANAYVVTSLARERRHGTLLGGGQGGITCWDWETGAQLSTLCTATPSTHPLRHSLSGCNEAAIVYSLAAGRDRLVAGAQLCNDSRAGTIIEWAVPDPKAIVEEPEAYPTRTLVDADSSHIVPESLQGLGESPDKILAGTWSGSICMWDCQEDPEQLPICWSLGDHTCPGVEVTCLAATDQVVVNGFMDGAMRIMRVDSPFVQHGS